MGRVADVARRDLNARAVGDLIGALMSSIVIFVPVGLALGVTTLVYGGSNAGFAVVGALIGCFFALWSGQCLAVGGVASPARKRPRRSARIGLRRGRPVGVTIRT